MPQKILRFVDAPMVRGEVVVAENGDEFFGGAEGNFNGLVEVAGEGEFVLIPKQLAQPLFSMLLPQFFAGNVVVFHHAADLSGDGGLQRVVANCVHFIIFEGE